MLQIIQEPTTHLERVATERKYYKASCDKSKEDLHTSIDCLPSLPATPQTLDILLHLSFDFAQQV